MNAKRPVSPTKTEPGPLEINMAEAYIVAALRTAGGRRNGRLRDIHSADLGAIALNAPLDRAAMTPPRSRNLTPLARIHGITVTAGDHVVMLEEPLLATDRALKRTGVKISDVDLYEVNEAFAPVPLAWLKHTGADPENFTSIAAQ